MTLSIRDYVSWQNVPGELALFDLRDGSYHVLNGSAAAIWRAIAAGQTKPEIIAALCSSHDAPADEIAQAVEAFIDNARAKGLLS